MGMFDNMLSLLTFRLFQRWSRGILILRCDESLSFIVRNVGIKWLRFCELLSHMRDVLLPGEDVIHSRNSPPDDGSFWPLVKFPS